jgi:hypothetical protein
MGNLQSPPPGTHRPVAPLAAVQVSCFKLVLATQHVPDGTGRLPFWRAWIAAADTWPTAARPMMAVKMVLLKSIVWVA